MPIRYSFWTDRPRTVRHRDYQNYLGLRFGTVVLGGIGLCILVMPVFGVTLQTSSDLAALPELSISDALSWDGDSNDPIKMEGFLPASNPYTMPDDDSLQVIRGELLVAARGDRDTGKRVRDERVRDEFFRWERTAIMSFFRMATLPTRWRSTSTSFLSSRTGLLEHGFCGPGTPDISIL